jgi:hypothetical protein
MLPLIGRPLFAETSRLQFGQKVRGKRSESVAPEIKIGGPTGGIRSAGPCTAGTEVYRDHSGTAGKDRRRFGIFRPVPHDPRRETTDRHGAKGVAAGCK